MDAQAAASHSVAIIGAGPAGLFAARELAENGVRVVLFNRDIKPGGLAEYGIYPDKHRMKEGLRKQFRAILAHPNITYYGNVFIGKDGDLSIDQLRALGFNAILVTAGAQGTKWLGLPGEDLNGVYHAKDLVYHYNLLPSFSQKVFHFGRRAAIIGAGNVMTDIARYLITRAQVDEIVVVARRGPGEVKFAKNELQEIVANLDLEAFEAEVRRNRFLMLSLKQNPLAPVEFVRSALPMAVPTSYPTRLAIRFLLSPVRILGGDQGNVTGLEVEHNTLIEVNGRLHARGLGTYEVLDVDTIIFAIGDRVDEQLGLPLNRHEFAINPNPRFPMDNGSYEVYDPQSATVIPDIFVAGWSRQASTGLVGVARRDGILGAQSVSKYLETQSQPAGDAQFLVAHYLNQLDKIVIEKADLLRLEAIEKQRAAQMNLEEFKFASNEDMLRELTQQRQTTGQV
ncbi:MAG TPA: FAD-dependent oxidoreductase [Levilinea sp.]|nr:FAD-dependent oxidoreductase [Levilinea sp.]